MHRSGVQKWAANRLLLVAIRYCPYELISSSSEMSQSVVFKVWCKEMGSYLTPVLNDL